MWHMKESTETFVTGWCSNCYRNLLSASVVYSRTFQDLELSMLIHVAMLELTVII
jgi:hypothetical protein